MESLWVQISTIFIAGVTGIWKGIPVGFAMQAHPLLTAGFTALGSIVLVMILLLSGEPFKQWILNRYGQKKLERNKGKFSRLMDRYGVAGIGLLGCGVIGPLLSTLLGLIFVRKTKKLIPFLIAGIIFWSSGLTAIATLSYQLFETLL
ncbi:MAG: hypothetical protein V5A59_08920 [Bacteroidales bacterium]|nr:hypothetical protein [Bacteroidales bacterium]